MSLRDALLKAGKVSKKDAQKAATDQRRRRKKQKGHRPDADRQAESEKRREARRAKQREADRARAAEARRVFEAHERAVRARNIIQGWRREPGRRRGAPWHFVRSDGHIGVLDLDAELAQEIQYGAAGIIEMPGDPELVVVVRREGIVKLLEFVPEIVKFYLGVSAPDDDLVNPPVLE